MVVEDSVLECHWESADGQFKTVQIVLLQSKVKKGLNEHLVESLGGYLGVSITLDMLRNG
jgi:hypothetical protein